MIAQHPPSEDGIGLDFNRGRYYEQLETLYLLHQILLIEDNALIKSFLRTYHDELLESLVKSGRTVSFEETYVVYGD